MVKSALTYCVRKYRHFLKNLNTGELGRSKPQVRWMTSEKFRVRNVHLSRRAPHVVVFQGLRRYGLEVEEDRSETESPYCIVRAMARVEGALKTIFFPCRKPKVCCKIIGKWITCARVGARDASKLPQEVGSFFPCRKPKVCCKIIGKWITCARVGARDASKLPQDVGSPFPGISPSCC